MPEQSLDITPLLSELNTKLRDLDEKQRLLKERVLLIGQNLVDGKENSEKEIANMKVDIQDIKLNMEKIKGGILRMSEELDKKARKSELELLQKQAKMFQPLEFARIEDVKNIVKKNIKK